MARLLLVIFFDGQRALQIFSELIFRDVIMLLLALLKTLLVFIQGIKKSVQEFTIHHYLPFEKLQMMALLSEYYLTGYPDRASEIFVGQSPIFQVQFIGILMALVHVDSSLMGALRLHWRSHQYFVIFQQNRQNQVHFLELPVYYFCFARFIFRWHLSFTSGINSWRGFDRL